MLCEIQQIYSNYIQTTICHIKDVEFWKWMQMRSDIHIYTKIPYNFVVSLIQKVFWDMIKFFINFINHLLVACNFFNMVLVFL